MTTMGQTLTWSPGSRTRILDSDGLLLEYRIWGLQTVDNSAQSSVSVIICCVFSGLCLVLFRVEWEDFLFSIAQHKFSSAPYSKKKGKRGSDGRRTMAQLLIRRDNYEFSRPIHEIIFWLDYGQGYNSNQKIEYQESIFLSSF